MAGTLFGKKAESGERNYKFRVTYSTNVDQHYRFDGNDTTVSMVVTSPTWEQAEKEADWCLSMLVQDIQLDSFKMVSVQRVDLPEDEG